MHSDQEKNQDLSEQIQELIQLQKRTDPVQFNMVMKLARDAARLYPTQSAQLKLRLVIGGSSAGR